MSDAGGGDGIGGFYEFVTRKTQLLKFCESPLRTFTVLPHHSYALRERLSLEVRLVSHKVRHSPLRS